MDIEDQKKNKYIALGYSVFFLMYLGIIAVLVGAIGSRGIFTAIREFSAAAKVLLVLSGLLFLNLFLAFDTWRVYTLSTSRRKVLMASAIFIAVAALANTILTWWSWLRELTPSELGLASVVGHSLVGLGYMLLAYLLVKVVTTINTKPQ